jgi:hypothetical protein
MRTTIRSESKLPEGHAKIPVSVPVAFTANDCLDIGTCLRSPCRWPTPGSIERAPMEEGT